MKTKTFKIVAAFVGLVLIVTFIPKIIYAFQGINLNQEKVVGEYVNGYHLRPKTISKNGVVITFGGSEGSSNLKLARKVAKKGYEVYSIYYFGQENQRESLSKVPIDFFEELYAEIEKNSNRDKPLTLIGSSRGAELALILASKYPDKIDNIVLYSPSAYSFGGIYDNFGRELPSWTYKGEEIPFLKQSVLFKDERGRNIAKKLETELKALEPFFTYLIEENENLEEASIDISAVKANILIFAGKDDQLWPSYKMAQKIIEEHQGKNQLITYENVGHSFGPTKYNNMLMGGRFIENLRAGKDSDNKLFETLKRWMQ